MIETNCFFLQKEGVNGIVLRYKIGSTHSGVEHKIITCIYLHSVYMRNKAALSLIWLTTYSFITKVNYLNICIHHLQVVQRQCVVITVYI